MDHPETDSSFTNNSSQPVERGLINVRDGTTIYYEVKGDGPPLLFCYGLVCRREHWHHQIDYFSKRYRVITFDYRGHQNSSIPKNDQHMTLEWCARDVEDLLAYLNIESVACLGHSMGVPVLAYLGNMIPGKVRAFVLVCGIVTNPFEHMFYSNRMNRVYQFAQGVYDMAPSFMNQVWAKVTEQNRLNYFITSRLGFNASQAQEKDVQLYMEGVNQTPFSIFQALIRDYTHFDGRSLLQKISAPSLVIAGEEDYITPIELQEEMARLLPKGELVTIPDGSHNAHMDFPERVNWTIDEFLRRVEYT